MDIITQLKKQLADLRGYPNSELSREDRILYEAGWHAAINAVDYWLSSKQEEIRGKG